MQRTGKGLITIDGKYNGDGVLKALLHNFDVDVDQPKPEHVAFLISKVLPLMKERKGHIWMQGSASVTGTHKNNLELSRRRVNNVATVLRQGGILESQMQLDAIGDNVTFRHIREDEMSRAVALLVLPRRRCRFPSRRASPAASAADE